MPAVTTDLLTDDMLAHFDERAPHYDAENRLFDEDLEELVASGYTRCALPIELGGSGLCLGLDEYTRLVRRLASVAPATALATNMHCYWVGLAADLAEMGDDSMRVVLDLAAEGKICPPSARTGATRSSPSGPPRRVGVRSRLGPVG